MIVLLPRQIVTAVQSASAKHRPLETGGFLIGLRRGQHIEVTGLTEQGYADIATRISFERADSTHRDYVHAAWSKSDALETLVGDWHSHPNSSGAPSSTDRRAWRKLARNVNQSVLGLIESGDSVPSVYLATKSSYWSAIELLPSEQGEDYIAYERRSR
jgi:integrative and conjugative element protein (TIGR02256 family)